MLTCSDFLKIVGEKQTSFTYLKTYAHLCDWCSKWRQLLAVRHELKPNKQLTVCLAFYETSTRNKISLPILGQCWLPSRRLREI